MGGSISGKDSGSSVSFGYGEYSSFNSEGRESATNPSKFTADSGISYRFGGSGEVLHSAGLSETRVTLAESGSDSSVSFDYGEYSSSKSEGRKSATTPSKFTEDSGVSNSFRNYGEILDSAGLSESRVTLAESGSNDEGVSEDLGGADNLSGLGYGFESDDSSGVSPVFSDFSGVGTLPGSVILDSFDYSDSSGVSMGSRGLLSLSEQTGFGFSFDSGSLGLSRDSDDLSGTESTSDGTFSDESLSLSALGRSSGLGGSSNMSTSDLSSFLGLDSRSADISFGYQEFSSRSIELGNSLSNDGSGVSGDLLGSSSASNVHSSGIKLDVEGSSEKGSESSISLVLLKRRDLLFSGGLSGSANAITSVSIKRNLSICLSSFNLELFCPFITINALMFILTYQTIKSTISFILACRSSLLKRTFSYYFYWLFS